MTIGGTQAYGEASYWDRRYTQDQSPFDWYQNYSALSPLLNLYLSPSNRLLVVGCGNSAFSEGMANNGYENIVNIDISSVVIEAMQKKYSNSSKLTYITMDVRNMSAFQTGSFDAVIDKGTLDSILCGDNSRQNSSMMLEEVRRVLKDNGVYILITYGVPDFRLDLLRNAGNWNIKLHIIGEAVNEVDVPLKSSKLKKIKHLSPVSLDSRSSIALLLDKSCLSMKAFFALLVFILLDAFPETVFFFNLTTSNEHLPHLPSHLELEAKGGLSHKLDSEVFPLF